MNFVNFINSQEPVSSWTTQKKLDFLNDWSIACGWHLGSGKTQQQTCNDFLVGLIKGMVDNYRRQITEEAAIASASYDEVVLEER